MNGRVALLGGVGSADAFVVRRRAGAFAQQAAIFEQLGDPFDKHTHLRRQMPVLRIDGPYGKRRRTPLTEHLDELVRQQSLRASGETVEVARAELGSDILTVGAAESAFTGLFADPASIA